MVVVTFMWSTAGVVALGMGAAAHWSFSRGFLGYLNAQAVLQMEAAVPRLQREYREHGSWEFVRGRPGAWFRMTRPDTFERGVLTVRLMQPTAHHALMQEKVKILKRLQEKLPSAKIRRCPF